MGDDASDPVANRIHPRRYRCRYFRPAPLRILLDRVRPQAGDGNASDVMMPLRGSCWMRVIPDRGSRMAFHDPRLLQEVLSCFLLTEPQGAIPLPRGHPFAAMLDSRGSRMPR